MKTVSPLPTPVSDDPAAAFLREVDEALKHERMLALWHRYKLVLFASILALLLGVAAWQGWQKWQNYQARTMADQWYAFSKLETPEAQRKALPALLASMKGGFRALAAFKQADLTDAPAEKAKSYALVYNDSSQPQWLQDLARLDAAIVLLGTDTVAAKTHLEALSQRNPNAVPSPAYAPALELLALLAQTQKDDLAARGYTQKLLEEQGLPDDMRQRALQRMGALSTLPGAPLGQ